MTEKQLAAVRRHGEQLLTLFPNAVEQDPVKLCKKLRRLEGEAHALALRLCNGPEWPSDDACESAFDAVDLKVRQLLANYEPGDALQEPIVPVRINRDPRGYALKISDEWMSKHKAELHRDLGGYGILAPEIGKDGAL